MAAPTYLAKVQGQPWQVYVRRTQTEETHARYQNHVVQEVSYVNLPETPAMLARKSTHDAAVASKAFNLLVLLQRNISNPKKPTICAFDMAECAFYEGPLGSHTCYIIQGLTTSYLADKMALLGAPDEMVNRVSAALPGAYAMPNVPCITWWSLSSSASELLRMPTLHVVGYHDELPYILKVDGCQPGNGWRATATMILVASAAKPDSIKLGCLGKKKLQRAETDSFYKVADTIKVSPCSLKAEMLPAWATLRLGQGRSCSTLGLIAPAEAAGTDQVLPAGNEAPGKDGDPLHRMLDASLHPGSRRCSEVLQPVPQAQAPGTGRGGS